ncbi:hypothetical protein SELMODRAFT_415874 [Selaginella moellendorffii]|uniref:Uncharacterized protein n=1 Tax=Selaginella moellendorffii TaxID=88036 RepID=D8RXI4_SELML|nr:hypothetical protein SELMODRAFT_415874 [Selaginella moellendorffii]
MAHNLYPGLVSFFSLDEFLLDNHSEDSIANLLSSTAVEHSVATELTANAENARRTLIEDPETRNLYRGFSGFTLEDLHEHKSCKDLPSNGSAEEKNFHIPTPWLNAVVELEDGKFMLLHSKIIREFGRTARLSQQLLLKRDGYLVRVFEEGSRSRAWFVATPVLVIWTSHLGMERRSSELPTPAHLCCALRRWQCLSWILVHDVLPARQLAHLLLHGLHSIQHHRDCPDDDCALIDKHLGFMSNCQLALSMNAVTNPDISSMKCGILGATFVLDRIMYGNGYLCPRGFSCLITSRGTVAIPGTGSSHPLAMLFSGNSLASIEFGTRLNGVPWQRSGRPKGGKHYVSDAMPCYSILHVTAQGFANEILSDGGKDEASRFMEDPLEHSLSCSTTGACPVTSSFFTPWRTNSGHFWKHAPTSWQASLLPRASTDLGLARSCASGHRQLPQTPVC